MGDNKFTIIENTEKARDTFGWSYGGEVIIITKENINALLDGKQLAYCDGEYSHFVTMNYVDETENKKKGE
jgi:hypothetical protein